MMHIPAWLDASYAPLLDATLRGAILLLVVLAFTHLLRRRSAAIRHALWAGAVCAQLLLVGWALAGPRWPVAIPHSLDTLLPATTPVTTADIAAPAQRSVISGADAGSSVPASNEVAPVRATKPASRIRDAAVPVMPDARSASTGTVAPTTPASTPLTWRAILLVAWALGVIVVLVRLAIGTVIVAALARRGARVEDGHWLSQLQRLSGALGISRPLTLLRGKDVSVPITWGVVYPVVLLPADADAWPDERRQFVLVHEMAHVKRLDALTQLIGQFALALFWFNPLMWVANRRMQLEREHACDDYVLRHGTIPSQYAEELLEMVRSLGATRASAVQPAFAALAMARRSEFEGRMLSILDPALSRSPLSRVRGLIGVVAAMLVIVPLAALRPYHQSGAAARPLVMAAPAAQKTARVVNPATGDEFPASFKVSITPDTGTPSSSAAFDSGAGALVRGMKQMDSALHGTGRALAATSAKRTTSPKSCDDDVVPGTMITSIHSDEDGDAAHNTIRYLHVNDDRCTEARLTGRVTFNDDETAITSMAPDAVVVLRERVGSDRRELTVRPNGSGVTYTYRRNGADATFDASAQRWFADMLGMMLRESAVNVAPRVARYRAQGGVDAVLRMIAGISSSSAKRAHYIALLESGGLSAADGDRIVRQASHDVASSGDLRAVLIEAAPLVRGQTGAAAAVEQAAEAVPSSGDRTAVLMEFGQTNDRAMLLSVMQAAATIPSSGDKARLLTELGPRYFAGNDAELQRAFFHSAATIPSSGDLRRVLTQVPMGYAGKSESVALAILAASSDVASSGDRTAVLLGVADSGALGSTRVRDAYLKAADGLASGDMNRVLTAAARR